MALYENVFIARQDLTAEQAETLTDDLAKIIEDQGGKIASKESWGLRSLAYRIKKNRKGHYVMLHIDAPAPAVQELERQMRIHEDVLRYLTLRVDEFDEGPSAIIQSKSHRDDRPRRGGPSRDYGDDKKPPRADAPRDTPDTKPDAVPPAAESDAAAPGKNDADAAGAENNADAAGADQPDTKTSEGAEK